MNRLRRLIRSTLIGGVLFLIPLVFAAVVVGKAFQIMRVIATPLGKLIPVEPLAGYAVVAGDEQETQQQERRHEARR
jgi:hypothetical protein